jgi:2-polyprenyl-3-methyl-5-hydroxy-6-metoxy-1,4-benzoquinol methylase
LPDEAAIRLENVPKEIQFFPTEEQLATDQGADLEVYQCDGCGLIQLSGTPVIYHEGTTSATGYSNWMLDYRRQQMQNFVESHQLQGKRILDVGCGDGHLLDVIKGSGAVPVGLDASEHAVEIAQQRGHMVHYGYAERDHLIEDGPFDAFVSTDVIEHVPDLKDFLQGIHRNIKANGVGLIETPDFEKVLATQRFYDFIFDHLSYFTRRTLRLALELSGFEVVKLEENRDNENLTVVVRRHEPVDFQSMHNQIQNLSENLKSYLSGHQQAGHRVGIWGASLQTLTLSAMLELDVAYIIDSAPYKQGRFTPVSHLPIVSPEILHTDPVDVILVNAPRYEREILQQIQTYTRFNGEVAVLDGHSIRKVNK